MKITILNMPKHNTFRYLESLVEGLRDHSRYKDASIQLISEDLRDIDKIQDGGLLDTLPISFVPALPSNPNILKEYVSGSDIVFIMCNTTDNDPDGYTFDIVNRLQYLESKAKYIVAECMHDSERDRIFKEGADAVIRPTRTYSSIFVRSVASLGSEEILEDLIDMETKYTVLKKDIKSIKWRDIFLSNYEKYGSAVGYYDSNGQVHLNPKFDEICDIKKLFFIKR